MTPEAGAVLRGVDVRLAGVDLAYEPIRCRNRRERRQLEAARRAAPIGRAPKYSGVPTPASTERKIMAKARADREQVRPLAWL